MVDSLNSILEKTKVAEKDLLKLSNENRNLMLKRIGEAILKNKEYILNENKKDIEAARLNGIKESMIETINIGLFNFTSMTIKEVGHIFRNFTI